MTTSAIRRTLMTAIVFTASAIGAPAIAGTGCNGVVNWFVWDCAGWDNNNGPKFPYYHKKAVAVPIPAGGIYVDVKGGAAVATINGQRYPVVNGAGGIVAAGGGKIVAAGSGNIVPQGGGNLQVWTGQ